jgi:UDP-N-acetylmuramoyl-L-alanyl-D-glutamate--2,6-diaminopimelate ligase
MEMKTIGQLFEGIECDAYGVNFDEKVDQIGHDSRLIKETGHPLFFAIRGEHYDGNSFVDGIRATNGNVIVASEMEHGRGIKIRDLNGAMAVVARRFYDSPDEKMKIIAITGTSGKSTIGFLIRHLLDKCGLIGTVEYDTGGQILAAPNTTPFALNFYELLAMCEKNGCRNVAMEISSQSLDQKRTLNLAVDVAIFNNLSHEHLDYHVTLEKYFETKQMLFDGRNGAVPRVSLVNIDGEYGQRLFGNLKASGQTAYSFGFSNGADFHIADIGKNFPDGSSFTLKHGNWSHTFETKLFGDHNISNITASLAAARILGLDLGQLAPRLAEFPGVPGRLERIPLKTGAMAYVDYANTPHSLELTLTTLRRQPHGRIISVFGCGGNRDRSKRAPMTAVVLKLSHHTIATADNPRMEPLEQIFADMKCGISPKDNIEFIHDRRDAIEKAIRMSQPGDIILIAGRGHEREQKIGNQAIHFNDREVIEEINSCP